MEIKKLREYNYIQKRIDRAVDGMIDIQDTGKATEEVQRILDNLNLLKADYQSPPGE